MRLQLLFTVATLLVASAAVHADEKARVQARDHRQFAIENDNSSFELNLGGRMQFQYIINSRSDTDDGGNDVTNGFQFRRAWLEADGSIIRPELRFLFIGDFKSLDNTDGSLGLLEARIQYDLGNGFKVFAGEIKPRLMREWWVPSKYQLAVDRSTAFSVFVPGYSQGVELNYTGDRFRWQAQILDGFGASDSNFVSPAESDIAIDGRLELRLGDAPWKQYADFTSFPSGERGVLLGIGGHWQRQGTTAAFDSNGTPTPAVDQDLVQWTADISAEGGGWNIFAAIVGRHVRSTGPVTGRLNTGVAGPDDFDDFGAVVQGGRFLGERTELFARWDAVFPDSDRPGGSDDLHSVTTGLNFYAIPASHAAKFTADVTVFLDDTLGSASVFRPLQVVNSTVPTDAGIQTIARLQFQLLF
ncbi:MAG: porin [Planctomycetota bacterium]